jgi:hypothetical protein
MFYFGNSFAYPLFEQNKSFIYPSYVGIEGGYARTTWAGLVPSKTDQNAALIMSTPTSVTEGGGAFGIFAGYELIPYFALEANYMRYPDANVSFDPNSIFSFLHDDCTKLTTHTETVAIMAKLMLVIPTTNIRVYSSFGAANIHRWDMISDKWRITPTFGVGFNYHFTSHLMSDMRGNYTAGYGQSELNPANNYIPFLYSITLGLAYRFSF